MFTQRIEVSASLDEQGDLEVFTFDLFLLVSWSRDSDIPDLRKTLSARKQQTPDEIDGSGRFRSMKLFDDRREGRLTIGRERILVT